MSETSLALSMRMNTNWSWGHRIVDELGGPVSSSHDHCAPDIPSPPQLQTAQRQVCRHPSPINRIVGMGIAGNAETGYRAWIQGSTANISEEPMQVSIRAGGSAKAAFCVHTPPMSARSLQSRSSYLATSQGRGARWIHVISGFAGMRDFCHWPRAQRAWHR
ncbi:hypothetical protein ACJ73_08863 [Blastomyces percursus]|uniref:Uncharacterized protein n=1 Tax=Blastomyces percursus TaxID=1658174 RepID=A0A1J9QN26_9EURO|nr:hypothetical protein ACJ73_08863 [Blastomyces percursus]